jgi:hypothetical protein
MKAFETFHQGVRRLSFILIYTFPCYDAFVLALKKEFFE